MATAVSFIAAPARAHFQELIPSTDIVSRNAGETIVLDVVFTHPFEGGPVEQGALIWVRTADMK